MLTKASKEAGLGVNAGQGRKIAECGKVQIFGKIKTN
jgi:hypothetical protein